jgi:very-long-chain enoyl-CoA reductase
VRRIPRGFLFELVSCPNYTFEILAWLAFSLMTGSLPSLLFCLAGAAQMYQWAKQKHVRYIKDFDGVEGRDLYPRSRKVLFPYLL